MNAVIDLLKSHRSIRKFRADPVPAETLHELIQAGQGAASSSFLQGVSVIQVNRPESRSRLARIANNQAYVETAPVFLVFCADLRRSSNCCEMHDAVATRGFTEQFIIATVDVALFAQNVATAAESAGLGICYIGALRNDPAGVCELLEIPEDVYPVFGMCLGFPDQDPEIKPRLPLEVVLKQDSYLDEDESDIQDYDRIVREYYRTRSGGTKDMSWSEQMSGLLGRESRPHMREFLRRQGFEMK